MPRRKPQNLEPSNKTTVNGEDKNIRQTVVMFADIIGASEISNHEELKNYAKIVRDFQELFKQLCKDFEEAWSENVPGFVYNAKGDEGYLMIYPEDNESDVSIHIDAAINIALELKRRWLWSDYNKKRINNGLLPIELGIGIHAGKTYLMEDKKPKEHAKLEGYAINLAKRVESESRKGRFSHIFLSEAAYGHVMNLADEKTYIFDQPQKMTPKGISGNIWVYEIKHHFLPSDWKEETETPKKTLIDPEQINMEILKKALEINPTNLWLTEESIRASLLKEEFGKAGEQAKKLIQSNQRDAGAYFIQGLVQGECGNYKNERDMYKRAIEHTEQLAEAHWYMGLSYSYEVLDIVGIKKDLNKIGKENIDKVEKALENYKKALEYSPQSAWMHYDYGCELIRWYGENKTKLEQGIDQIIIAANRLDSVRDKIPKEDYLEKALGHPKIKELMKKAKN